MRLVFGGDGGTDIRFLEMKVMLYSLLRKRGATRSLHGAVEGFSTVKTLKGLLAFKYLYGPVNNSV